MTEQPSGPVHDIRPERPRWTHVALRVADVDASIAWYQEFTPLELLERRADDDGFGAWLGQSARRAKQSPHPSLR